MEKRDIRAQIREKRKALSEAFIKEQSRNICKKIAASKEYQNAETVFAYMALPGEVDLSGLILQALKDHKKVAIPKVHKDIMEFYEITSLSDVEEGSFHVLEPVSTTRMIPENTLFLMPGVAFDKRSYRVGYGKGYYDKYLTKYFCKNRMGVAFQFQIYEEVPADSFDIPAGKVITEGGFI